MKTLNVIYVNHLDLTWRRPRYSSALYDGYTIRSYSQLQERMLDHGLQFVREGGVYEIEQTTTLREYIENNPDLAQELAGMIADGRLRISGGGEAVIDYNMPDGESIIRNHFYSVRYLREAFGRTPEFAACPDTFGLSAGLPQLFRQLGFSGLSMYHRVFQGNKPCWRGIDGSVIALDTANYYAGRVLSAGTFKKCPVCPVCSGEGCPACDGRGYIELLCPESPAALSKLRRAILTAEEEVVTLVISGEESAVIPGFVSFLREVAEEGGFRLNFTGTEAMIKEKHAKLIENVKSGLTAEEDIDPRPEGGPVAGGCYTSRIRLKQENRRCESALRSAERLSVMAAKFGALYPAAALERLWRKLAFIQFHDALPASHSDAAYDELMNISRELRAKAGRLALNAARRIIGVEADGSCFAVFNPLEFDVRGALLTGVGNIPRSCNSAFVTGPDGGRTPVLSIRRSADPYSEEAVFSFYGGLPALGYSIFKLDTGESCPEASPVAGGGVIENEYFRITLSNSGISEIYDKRSSRIISGEGSFAPVIEDDAGNPWARTSVKGFRDRADRPLFGETMLPQGESAAAVTISSGRGIQSAVIHISYSLPERQLKKLDWTLTLTLPDGADGLDIKIEAAMDARDLRLMTILPLAFAPEDGKLLYEIPLGSLKRGAVEVFDRQLGYSDDYAALRYVRATDGELAVTLCNNGTPAHRIENRTVAVSLLRSPTQLCCGFDTDGASDSSLHVFRFTLSASCESSLLDSYRRGMILNTDFPAFKTSAGSEAAACRAGTLVRLPDNALLSALKGAESGEGIICRYIEAEGQGCTLSFEEEVAECDILEYSSGKAGKDFSLKPYEIKTFRL